MDSIRICSALRSSWGGQSSVKRFALVDIYPLISHLCICIKCWEHEVGYLFLHSQCSVTNIHFCHYFYWIAHQVIQSKGICTSNLRNKRRFHFAINKVQTAWVPIVWYRSAISWMCMWDMSQNPWLWNVATRKLK